MRYLMVVLCGLLFWSAPAFAEELSSGQTVYVPAYSHIYHGSKARPFQLAVTLSVRNTDVKESITLTSLDFYDTQGKLLKVHLLQPEKLGPLATREVLVDERDVSGGSGANFIVRWRAEKPVNPPIVEAVMIGTQSQQGISFRCVGRVVQE
ncbi:MAG: DUF3124 domain-containing protein [Desulfovibrionaceae bacterium]